MSFPGYIDNTIRKAFATCPMKMMRAHVQNLRPVGNESIDLAFGRAFARGLEVTRVTFFKRFKSAMEAIEAGIEAAMLVYGEPVATRSTYKSAARLVGALQEYFKHYPLGEDGFTPVKDGIECSFSIPLPVEHPETREPIVYVGRYDLLAKADNDNRFYVVDEKTASRLGDSWDMKWDMDAQMTGYAWAASYHLEKLGYPIWEMEIQGLVRGISILKDSYGHVEVPLVRSSWFINQWYQQLLRDVNRMVDSYKTGQWDKAMHENACVQYMRRCDFMPLCLSPNPERLVADPALYKIEVWNPLDKN